MTQEGQRGGGRGPGKGITQCALMVCWKTECTFCVGSCHAQDLPGSADGNPKPT